MRSNQQKSRSRGRSNNNNNNNSRRNSNPLSRSYESNGPDVRVRGNAAHVAEKYVQLAQDANQTGDSVAAENYLQHAEHYFRIVSAAQAQVATQQQAQQAAHQAQQAANQARQVELKTAENNVPATEPASKDKTEDSEGVLPGANPDAGAAPGEAETISAPEGESTSASKSETPVRPRRPRRRPRQDKPIEDVSAPVDQAKSAAAEKSDDPVGESVADAADPAGAPQPDAGELPAFVTNAGESSAAE